MATEIDCERRRCWNRTVLFFNVAFGLIRRVARLTFRFNDSLKERRDQEQTIAKTDIRRIEWL